MVLTTDDDINEFIKIWKEEFDEDISFGDAQLKAEALLTLYGVLQGIIELP